MTDIDGARAEFERALEDTANADDAYRALQVLADAVVGTKLFTVMTVDKDGGVARRAYSSDPDSYPASGTKPIVHNEWFEGVSRKRQVFVANTLGDIAKVFPDHELIGSLGCGSVINLPVFVDDTFVATVNLLHEEHRYTDERVALAKSFILAAGERVMRRNFSA